MATGRETGGPAAVAEGREGHRPRTGVQRHPLEVPAETDSFSPDSSTDRSLE